VVFGQWKNLPLRTLYNALVEKKIVDLDQIKVLDKASVSATFCRWFARSYVKALEVAQS